MKKKDFTNPKDLLGVKKPQLDLIPITSMVYQAIAMADGAKKYGAYNWREKKVKASIYYAAAMRHMAAWFNGEEVAKDSLKPHLAHAIANIGILIDAYESGNLINNRPIALASVEDLLAKWTNNGKETTRAKRARTSSSRNKKSKKPGQKSKKATTRRRKAK